MITKDSSNMWCDVLGFLECHDLFVTTLCSPNEDFGWPNERLGTHFRSTFQRVSTRFGLRSFEKCFENAFPNVRSVIQNLRLGSINFARWLQKIVASYDEMCWFFWDATIFCNNFARWLQKIVACDAMCWISGMILSFVTTLQDDYKR